MSHRDDIPVWIGLFGGGVCGCLAGFVLETIHAWYYANLQRRQRAFNENDSNTNCGQQ